eukprot:gb/GECG01014841.1/.p1 GENE.gb/GECG01014841.1/~~gb/GECG01014841.1/.p1  ORF type:complete len:659 (+),score=55.76 gb/GECG01014841.1/:1-1977(+)
MRSNRPNKRSSIPPVAGIGGSEAHTAGTVPAGHLHRSKAPSGASQNHGRKQPMGDSGVRGVRMGTIPGRYPQRRSTEHSRNSSQEAAASPVQGERTNSHARSPPLSSMMGFTMTSRDISKLRSRYEALLHDRSLSFDELKFRLRRLAITEGIPNESVSSTNDGIYRKRQLTLRGRVWLLLLDVETVDPQLYFELVEQGPAQRAHFIEQDTLRTFTSDEAFQSLVKKPKMVRLLNSFSHWCRAISKSCGEVAPIVNTGYVQGMNRLAAPLLMVLPEVPAFSCFCNLLTQHIPRWFEGGVLGVTDGCDLVDECLNVVDPELRNHLIGQNSNYTRQVFAFSRILSLYACCEPATQVLQVWDALFSFGIHLVVLLCAAEAILKRDEILASNRNAVSLLNAQSCRLNASALINGAMEILPSLPPRLYKRVIAFPFVTPDQVARKSEKKMTEDSRHTYNSHTYTSQLLKGTEENWVKPVSSATRKRLERKAQEEQDRSQFTNVPSSSSRREVETSGPQYRTQRNPPPPPPPRSRSTIGKYRDSEMKPVINTEPDDGDDTLERNEALRKVAENAQTKLRQKLSHHRSSSTPRGRTYSGELLGNSRPTASGTVRKSNSFRMYQEPAASRDYDTLSKSSIFSPILVDRAKQASSPRRKQFVMHKKPG